MNNRIHRSFFILSQFIVFGLFGQINGTNQKQVNDPNLKTIQLYPYTEGQNYPTLRPAVFTLNSSEQWILEFDDLLASYRQFHVKIVHCNLDWTPSRLRDLEFLNDYNDFIINNYEVSQGTKVKYFHYGFELPKVKVAGNYILEIYENDLYGTPVASLRFRVLQPHISLTASVQTPQDPTMWRTHQQVNFELGFGNYDVRNPRSDFHIEIRQNFRDETIKTGFTANAVNGSRNTLTYRFFDNENLFKAGNEFRYVDLRSTFTRGDNIADVKQLYEDQVWLKPQIRRSDKTYLNAPDLNGRYVIETRDNGHPSVTADYVNTFVVFESEELPPHQKMCFLGGFNEFKCEDSGEMVYDYDKGYYQTKALLKQGMYDFQFAIAEEGHSFDFTILEGDFTDTGNSYEIFVYHQPPSARAALLVGYYLIENTGVRR
ncbi:type IX secretion system plug protein [Jiulongibacter sediminis]|uniref:Type 9 secretion system plug protein N-terminal domain-containing protein n=1 Tax=Jiulongibacter sediminis TaxID=1605367 RepID=A0A0P7BZU1_9BACT|nr:DUF5103 domain-containing protein [Jiulongibacter sediminis]KPM49926.1 hypothetical protein AFM12_04995 [Jiulongibacter sediminis]TBX26962.1 hypothetical protein TK44_05000 [Jiulongibacter sediminis]